MILNIPGSSTIAVIAVIVMCLSVLGHPAPVFANEAQQRVVDSFATASEAVQDDEKAALADVDAMADTFYRKAYALFEKKKYAESISLLEQAIAENPENADLYSLKSYCHAELKDYEQSMAAAKQAIAIDPEDAGLYELLANSASFLNDVDTAIENYRRSLALNDRNARVYNNYLSTLKDQKRWLEVKQVYARFEDLQDRDQIDELSRFEGDIHFYASLAHQESGDNASALKLLDKAIGSAPDFSGYYVNRGTIRNEQKDYTQALVDYNKAIELNPKDELAYFNRGNTFLLLEKYEQAIKDFLSAQKLGKKDESMLLNLGNAYKGAGQYVEALEAYKKVRNINPANKQVENNLAILYGLMGETELSNTTYRDAQHNDQKQEIPLYNQAVGLMGQSVFDKAIPLLLQALTLKPDFQEAYNQLGICYLEQKQYSLAQRTLSTGIQLHPENSGLYANRAIAFSRLGDFLSAERDYLQALKLSPALLSVYGDLAGMFQNHGDLVKAKYYFDLAERAGVETQDYYVNRIAFLLRENDAKKAVALGEAGYKLYPKNTTLMLNLASAYQDFGQVKKAVKLLEMLIEIDPNNSSAHHNRGNIYHQVDNDCRNAVKHFRASISKDGSRIEPYLNLAGCYESLSQHGDAEKTYFQMAERFPERYEVYYNRGNFRYSQDMSEQGAQDFERSFVLMDKAQALSQQNTAEEDNRYSLLKANAYQRMQRFEEASKAYQHFLVFNKTDAEAFANHAYCLVEIGNPQLAMMQFEASHQLRSGEIDAIIGLYATHSLLNDTAKAGKYRRLAEAALKHPLSAQTLDELTGQGYFYGKNFRRMWLAALEK